MSGKIAGVVVLYNPDEKVVDNIKTYAHQLDKLYLVDNSETPSVLIKEAVQKEFNFVEYFHLPHNQGIAKALNTAASKAFAQGFTWLLTMDQDSRASSNMIGRMLTGYEEYQMHEIGILAPRYLQQTDKFPTPLSGLEEVDVVITSGNLLNLEAYAKVGPFREDFFIDYVDHEYCLRLKLAHYKIIVNNSVVLYHELGDSQSHLLFGHKVISSHHNSLRRYYITRNRLSVLKVFKTDFPEYYKQQRLLNMKEIIKLLLFEKDKLSKIRSVFWGYLDYRRKIFGKYRHK
jgi:rhamnosyltransferase